jgi:hypothetical protein
VLIEKMLPDYFECVREIMKPLNEHQQKQLVGLLHRIQRDLANDEVPDAVKSVAAV